ncbi:MAG: LUD domain-containing protein [Bacteroidota bacterium]
MNAREKLFAALRGKKSGEETGSASISTELSAIHTRLENLDYGRQDGGVDRFLARAKAAGSQVFRCATAVEAVSLLVNHVGSGKRCVLTEDALLSSMSLRAALAGSGCDLSSVTDAAMTRDNIGARRLYAGSDFGISVALAGLADSGAVVISSSQKESRSVSLLPIEHVALLPASRILPSLLQAAPMIRELQQVSGSSAVTIVGGPSKTADIEKVLVTGVHGPAALTIIVIDDPD